MPTDSALIKALLKHKAEGTLHPNNPCLHGDTTPLDEATIKSVEARLGFFLPPLLKRVYCEVANGGFGDSYGLLGMVGGPLNEDGRDAVSVYECYRKPDPDDDYWTWPTSLLPICHLGCAMYHCIDCNTSKSPIIWFEPNIHVWGYPWNDSFISFCPALSEYLAAWLNGEDLWAKLNERA